LSAEGVIRGWTHRFISPETLNLPTAVVRGGRLAPDGPAFRALVFEGDAFHGRQSTMPVETAEKLLELAGSGLPVLAVGDWSNPVPSGLDQGGERDRLKTLFQQLLSLPNVVNVPDRAAIREGLEQLGISRLVVHEPVPLSHEVRSSGPVRLFAFANTGNTRVRTTLSIESSGPDALPFRLNTWTGEIQPLAHFSRGAERIYFPVTIEAGSTLSLALAPTGWAGFSPGKERQVLSISGGEPFIDRDGSLRVRAFSKGPVEVRTADGRTTLFEMPAMPETPSGLTAMDLEVEAWTPGETPASTRKETLVIENAPLLPWTEVPGLGDVSGTASYRGEFNLPDWTANAGAMLDLGEIFNTVKLRVNGADLPPVDPLSREVDLGGYLRKGRNKIEIEVTTTLNNQLRVAVPEVFSINSRQPYGPSGPLRLRPYREIIVP
jgi:hypothetical protein